ncbi:hypothetical protein IMZ11_28525 [Microtetraspora sp. AC03309]|uniref:hypothetical protein n=1 Tax=Microtetraspora sp. AC03309 TaxID=2779376 RepID=UPI001E3BF486|nr:hypothetical protein [Microtetraspora sp. AC03309]MCC5579581.1 hypothetical protein [Microtetraspora sp. AC03309]
MPGIAELIYTTAGGLIGSLVTIVASQSRDRRANRAACQAHLHRLFVLGAATEILDDRRDQFQEALVTWETAALTAGLPYGLVDLHVEARDWFFYVLSTHQQQRDVDLLTEEQWEKIVNAVCDVLVEIEALVKSYLWHPLRGRMLLPLRIRRIRTLLRATMELRDQVEAQRIRITDAWIARKNAELESASSEVMNGSPGKDLDVP